MMWATKLGDDAPWSRSRRWKLNRCTSDALSKGVKLTRMAMALLSINITQHDMIEVGSDHFSTRDPTHRSRFPIIPHHSCIIYLLCWCPFSRQHGCMIIVLPTAMKRRSQLVDDAAKATNAGAVAKSGSNDALAAASAKQAAIAAISLLDHAE